MEKHAKFEPDPSLKLMDKVRQVLRYHHYALRTERTCCDWILRFIRFHGAKKHSKHMGKTEIEAFYSAAPDIRLSFRYACYSLKFLVLIIR